MRSLVLLFGFMAAFYVLFEDKTTQDGNGKKTTSQEENKPAQVQNEFENSFFESGLPQDYSPTDLTRYGSVYKLIDDLDYRRMRMHHQMDLETKEFRKTNDVDGKDKEAFQALLKKHYEAKNEFKKKYAEQIKEYRKMKTEMKESNDKGLH